MMRFVMIIDLILVAIISIAGESDIVITTTENTIYLCSGEESTLAVFVNDPTGEITDFRYQWFYSETQILTTDDGWTEIDGENSSTLSLENILAETSIRNVGYYYCKVYLGIEYTSAINSERFIVNVNQPISIYPPLSSSLPVCSGADTSISIVNNIYEGSTMLDAGAFESVGITFAWHRQDDAEIISEDPVLRFTALQNSDNGYYVCEVTNSCGTENAGPIYVNVIVSPLINIQPQDVDVCTGDALTVSLSAEGDQLRYSWYRDGAYIGNNYSSYTVTSVVADYGGLYNCVITSELGCPTAYSDTIMVTVGTTPEITMQPDPVTTTLCEGSEYELAMSASGDGVRYQWYNNGITLEGQTTDRLHISNVSMENAGSFYCIILNGCDEIQTEFATLIVNTPNAALSAEIIDTSAVFCSSNGLLNAIPNEIGEGTWSSSDPDVISFDEPNSSSTTIHSEVINHEDSPYTIYWTVSDGACSAKDSIEVRFGYVPSHSIDTTVSNYVTIGDHSFFSTGNYTFTIPSETGCDTIYDIHLRVLAEPVYGIGPNPTKGLLNINSDGFISIVEFYKTTGQFVMRKEVNGYEAVLDMQGLVSGMYIIRIYGEESSMPSFYKVVKE